MKKSGVITRSISLLLACFIIMMIFPTHVSAHADTSGVDTSSPWYAHEKYNNTATYSIDTNVKYGNSAFSIVIRNIGYDYATVRKDVTLKPNTQYRFSAMVRYSGYELEPGAGWDSGASLGVLVGDSWRVTGYNNTGDWVRISYNFTTDQTGKTALYLRNGYPYCKGTAYYSDIRLEEVVQTTDQWNILILIVKGLDADILKDGTISHYKNSFSNDDISYIKNSLPDQLKYQLPRVSDKMIGVRDVDVYVTDNVITDLSLSQNCIEPYDKVFRKEMDKYLEKKTYQQIITIVPFERGTVDWLGLGGTQYNGINFCQYIHHPGDRFFDNRASYADYTISGYIHEILHGVESDSKTIDGDAIPDFHENIGIYSKYYNDEIDGWFSYHHDYITSNLPDGRGINAKVLYRPSRYLLISDEMGVNGSILVTINGWIPQPISSLITASTVKSVAYDGKPAQPSVNVSGGTSGKDYTISYADNDRIGTGKVIISGANGYYGSVELMFTIKLKKVSLKYKSSSLSWNKVPGAEGYQIYCSKNGGKYKKSAEISGTSFKITNKAKGTYKYKVRAYSKTDSGVVYGAWSKVKKVKIK
ncbi:MAG: hypothetical protein K6E85_09280 [Lachnospiraceae bacterium]|nr:hypothetical protein [Lachnospiraceae bacterium]